MVAEELVAERPLLLDPASEDPSVHLCFKGEFAVEVDASARGAATIKSLALNRDPLVAERREALLLFRELRDALLAVSEVSGSEAEELAGRLARRLEQETAPSGAFSAMKAAALRG